MKPKNRRREEPELEEKNTSEGGAEVKETPKETQKESPKESGITANKVIMDVMGGKMLSREGFVRLFPFVIYVVVLSMLYITNIYIAEDISRETARLKSKVENLHVEYVYLQSEITRITKQSNMVEMLKDKGIKESVDPLRKIIVVKEGGSDEGSEE